ncbi:MAG: hypothetical protein KAW46_03130 [candidate division Zixibacteria bacterium]|nr:hypothetical protein [candidate division Zixibacteria bacterium]
MTKMDMIWVAVASMIHPITGPSKTVSRSEIVALVSKLFDATIRPIMIEKHLVNWEDRQANKAYPRSGGSRKRYLFKTADGHTPSRNGQFRLYKAADGTRDGWEKDGPTCPVREAVADDYCHLVDWYKTRYFETL